MVSSNTDRGDRSWADTESSSEVDSKDVLVKENTLVTISLAEAESIIVLATES